MALSVETSVEINQPIEEVFATLTDIANHPHWVGAVDEIRDLSDNPIQMGTTWQQVGRMMGREILTAAQVIAYDPPYKCAAKGVGLITAVITWELNATESGGTRVRMQVEGESAGTFMTLATPLLVRNAQQQITSDMQNLKKLMEAR